MFRRNFRGFQPKPVRVGEEYDVEIKEVGSKGDGIARIKNFVIFVDGAKKGEKLRIKITQVKRNFATAKKVEAAKDVTEEMVKEAEAEVKK